MIAVLRRWLSDWRDPHVPLSEVLKETREKLAEPLDGDKQIVPPTVVFAKPERDEIKPNSVHMWSDADVLAHELKREAERTQQQTNVVQIKVRGTVGR